MKQKIYVGCSLTQAPQEFKDAIEALKTKLRENYEVLDFIGTAKGTPRDVYMWDIHRCVQSCDLFLAICDLPSIGLGWELAVAVEVLKKPVLAVAHQNTKLTRLLIGAGEEHTCLDIKNYGNISDIPSMVREKIPVAVERQLTWC